MEGKIYIIKTLRMMNYLVRNGFDCKKVKRDKFNTEKVVFCFEDTRELRQALNNYKK